MNINQIGIYLLNKLQQNGFQKYKEEDDLLFSVTTQPMNIVLAGMKMKDGDTCWGYLRKLMQDRYSCVAYKKVIDNDTYYGVYWLSGVEIKSLRNTSHLVVLTKNVVCISYDFLYYSVYNRYLPAFFAEVNNAYEIPYSPLNNDIIMGYRKL